MPRTPIASLVVGPGCGDWQSGKKYLKQDGGGSSLGIPPLRARDFLKGKNFRGAAVGMTDANGIGETAICYAGLGSDSKLPGSPLFEMTISNLNTEQQNPASAGLDTKSALEIARIINTEDKTVAGAVERALPQIAQAIDAIAEALLHGGRLIYVGAGTSGRLAAPDGSECPPTFNTAPQGVRYETAWGAGEEMVLNRGTTGAMGRLGYIYGHRMVNVHTKNEKLMERGVGILEKAVGVDQAVASRALKASGNQVAVALIMLKSGVDRRHAEKKLKAAKGNVRKAIGSI